MSAHLEPGAAARVKLMEDLSLRLQRCGPIYLATLLVSEAYSNEMLRRLALGGRAEEFMPAALDAAALEMHARLSRYAFPPPEPAPKAEPRRARRAKRASGVDGASAVAAA